MDLFSFLLLNKIYAKDEDENWNFASNDFEIDFTLLAWLNLQAKKYRNKYLIENEDEDFNNVIMQELLNTLWWTGRVAISRFNNKLDIFTFIEEKVNYNGGVNKARGFHSAFLQKPLQWKNIKGLTEFNLHEKNTVFAYYNSVLFSGFVEALELGSRYTKAWKVYDKNLLLSQKMMIFSNSENIETERGILNSIKKIKIGISKRFSGYNIFNKQNSQATNLIKQNDSVETLEFTPNLQQIKNAIDNIKSEYDEFYGNKTNINFKRERQITGEMDLMDYHFDLIERDTTNNIEIIIKKINKMWNKNYQLKTLENQLKENDLKYEQAKAIPENSFKEEDDGK